MLYKTVLAVSILFSLFYLSDQFLNTSLYFLKQNKSVAFSQWNQLEKRRRNVVKKAGSFLEEKKSMNKMLIEGNKIKDIMEFDGVVNECLADTNFIVKLDTGEYVQCYISGRLRTNKVKIDLGDFVKIQIHKLDLEKKKGRIILRYVNQYCHKKGRDKKRKKNYNKYNR